MDVYKKFIGNFMRAKSAIEIAKQARPVFAKFLEVSLHGLSIYTRSRMTEAQTLHNLTQEQTLSLLCRCTRLSVSYCEPAVVVVNKH